MITIKGRNVNSLWAKGLMQLRVDGIEADSRAGRVLVAPCPVMSVYERPTERVLFDPLRDANPFFHLMESLWMLAGRDDAAFLDRYVGDFGKRFAEHPEDPEVAYIHGAYGRRWRKLSANSFGERGTDQLNVVVEKLRANPDDRQCVIQMWDATMIDGEGGCDDLEGAWRDRPCNTHVYLRVRSETCRTCGGSGFTGEHNYGGVCDNCGGQKLEGPPKLDLTVLCRSNDIVWGAYGANAVHFSVLQEYLAGRIGVGVGTMYQFSNNWHGYVDVVRKYEYPRQVRQSLADEIDQLMEYREHYDRHPPTPMGTDWERWDEDLAAFMRWHDSVLWNAPEFHESEPGYTNQWFRQVATPVAIANWCWKAKKRDAAMYAVAEIAAPDWRRACVEWMQRRMK